VTSYEVNGISILVRSLDNVRVVIPTHSGVAIKRKTLRSIVEDLRVTIEEITNLI